MLDSIVVFRKTGVVLWQQVWAAFKGADPVHAVIHTVLLEDRAGTTPMYQDANYSVKWAVDNEMEIVVAAVYQRVLPLTHVDELLERVRAAFVGLLRGVSEASRDDLYPCARFTKTFATLEADVEARAREARSTAKKTATPRTFEQSKKFANTRQGNKQSCAVGGGSAAAAANDSPSAAAAANGDGDDGASADGPAGGTSGLSEAQVAANIAKLKGGGPGAFRKKKSSAAVVEGGEGEAVGSEGKKKGKEGRSWDGSAPGEAKQTLDYSKKEGSATSRTTVFRGSKVDLDAQFGVGAGGDEDEEEEEGEGAELAAAAGSAPAKASGGGMFAAFRGLVGGKTLERADVAPLMETLLQKMIEKNVAQEIGEQICESVCTTLLGKQLGSFSSLRQTVRGAMDATLTRILTPSLRVDLLAGVERAQAEKRPCARRVAACLVVCAGACPDASCVLGRATVSAEGGGRMRARAVRCRHARPRARAVRLSAAKRVPRMPRRPSPCALPLGPHAQTRSSSSG